MRVFNFTSLYRKLFWFSSIAAVSVLAFVAWFGASNWFSNALTSAQSNQKQINKTSDDNFEVLKFIKKNPCRFKESDFFFDAKDDKPIYELMNAGFPKESSLEEAVAVFNEFAKCYESGKNQPQLRAEEAKAAIRDWVCDGSDTTADEKKVCSEFRRIAETGKVPKGALFETTGGVNGYRGYDVDAWGIRLRIRLDKHRNDLKGEPQFDLLIRMNYLSSEPTKY